MNQFGFVQPANANQLMNASQLSIAPATPTPVPFLTQTKAVEEIKDEMPKTSFPSTSTARCVFYIKRYF